MATVLAVIFTGVIALCTYLVWKCYARIEWVTGAMETHSNLTLMIEVSRRINGQPIEMIWWDPSIEGWPSNAQHGAPAELKEIRIGVPAPGRAYVRGWAIRRTCEAMRN